MAYDVIGDVHGCSDALEQLLAKLSYVKRAGSYEYSDQKHPRTVIFLGDILDRGPKIREAMTIVRNMVERGSARIVMGNHEFNALAYTTPVPGTDKHVLPHTERQTRLIRETLEQYANHPAEWRETLEWLRQFPFFFDEQDFRVVHACWDDELIAEFRRIHSTSGLSTAFIIESEQPGSFSSRFVNRITRGCSLRLPDAHNMFSEHGYRRKLFRTKFWVESPETYGDVEFQPNSLPATLAGQQLSDAEKRYLPYYGPQQPPLFVGHYWQRGDVQLVADNIACLDYSAVNNGRLVAYRMDGESRLSASKFVWIDGVLS